MVKPMTHKYTKQGELYRETLNFAPNESNLTKELKIMPLEIIRSSLINVLV